MSKVVFYSIPGHGHINPTLPVISELIKRGEQVIYYSTQEFAKVITSTGAEYREYVHLRSFNTIAAGQNLALLYLMIAQATKDMLPTLLSDINNIKPDYIIHDALSMWGRHIASITQKPTINSITTFAFNYKNMNIKNTIRFIAKVGFHGIINMRKAYRIQKDLFKIYGTKPLYFIDSMMNEEQLNIVFNSRLFQPHHEYYDNRYKFIGPSIPISRNDSDNTDYSSLKHPIIYISMGTIWSEHCDIKMMIQALKIFDCSIVISYKGDKSENNESNVYIKKYVNQLEILKYADLFITHGGMNSVNEGLYNHVPLCIYPFQAEQDEVANRVVELGCGEIIKKMKKTEIRKMVQTILYDKNYTKNCQRISNSFIESGGFKEAADQIMQYANNPIK